MDSSTHTVVVRLGLAASLKAGSRRLPLIEASPSSTDASKVLEMCSANNRECCDFAKSEV